MQAATTYNLTVRLNGTGENPYHQFGLTCNPFPQLGVNQWDERPLQKLGGDPIPHDNAEAYIRETLKGFSQDFVDLCVSQFRPGKYIEFEVTWMEGK
jgi:hypothetical protein